MYVCTGLIALFAHSCATDASADPADTLAPTSIEFRNLDPDPETDCKCYMRILSARNFGEVGGELPDAWGLIDVTYSTIIPDGFQIDGYGGYWKNPITNVDLPLPSEFFELDSPSNGVHTFWLAFFPFSSTQERPTLNTEVECRLQNNDGTETVLTTTIHEFKWDEGRPGDISEVKVFEKEFSCYYLTEDIPVGRN